MPHITISHRGMLYKMVPIEDFQTLHEVLTKFSVTHPDVDVTTHQFSHRRLGLVNMKQAFRLTGLETNAQLETVEIPPNQRGGGIIKIAVQVEGGNRLQADVAPRCSLWECLLAAGASNGDDLVGRASPTGVYLMPCVSMQAERKEYADLLSLNRTTLNDLGITKGSVLMRVKLKPSEPALTLAAVQAQLVGIEREKKERADARDRARAEAADKKAVEEQQKADIRKRRDEEAKAAVAAAANAVTEESKLTAIVDRLVALLQAFKATVPAADYSSTLTLLAQITNNLVKFPPMDDNAAKYRSLSLTNPTFAAKIARFPSAVEYLQSIGFTAKPDEPTRLQLLFANENTSLFPVLVPRLNTLVDGAKAAAIASSTPAPAPTVTSLPVAAATPIETSSSSSSSSSLPIAVATPVSLPSPPIAAPAPSPASSSSSSKRNARSSGMGLGEMDDRDDYDNEDDYRPSSTSSRENAFRSKYGDLSDDDNNDEDRGVSNTPSSSSAAAAAPPAKKAKLIGDQAPIEFDDDDTMTTGPEYDIGDVRRAVASLFASFTDVRQFLATMKTLIMITEKLQNDSSPAARTFSLANAKFNEKVGQYSGAMAYLTFLGFEKVGEQLLMNATSEHRRKTDRALSVMRMLLKEKTPSADEMEVLELGPVDRQSAIYEFDAKTSLTAGLPSATEAGPVVSESALVLDAHRKEAKRNRELYPTDAIVFRKQREEDMKSKRARRYPATLIRVQFPDNTMLLGYFRPWETLDAIYAWIAQYTKPHIPLMDWYVMAPPVKFQADQRTQTVKQLSLLPSAMLIFKCTEGSSNAIDVLRDDVISERVPFDASTHPLPVPLNKDTLDAIRAKEKADADAARREAQLAAIGGGAYKTSGNRSAGAKDDSKTAKLRGFLGKR